MWRLGRNLHLQRSPELNPERTCHRQSSRREAGRTGRRLGDTADQVFSPIQSGFGLDSLKATRKGSFGGQATIPWLWRQRAAGQRRRRRRRLLRRRRISRESPSGAQRGSPSTSPRNRLGDLGRKGPRAPGAALRTSTAKPRASRTRPVLPSHCLAPDLHRYPHPPRHRLVVRQILQIPHAGPLAIGAESDWAFRGRLRSRPAFGLRSPARHGEPGCLRAR
jgi:hypothetical protein